MRLFFLAPQRVMRVLFFAAYATTLSALAQPATLTPLPVHTTPHMSASGETCDQGFRSAGTGCQPIVVPNNAYLADHGLGRGWECAYGYRLEKNACVRVVPPDHGFVTGFAGDQWTCERTYVRVSDRCVPLKLPRNAIATSRHSASGWTCERGYLENDGRCERIVVPPNAYLDTTSPSGWSCERGYRVSANQCWQIVVPPHGYLSSAYGGPGFECERGYRATDVACVAVTLPANAHLDYSGNDWDCNRPYRRDQNGCELNSGLSR